METFAINLLDQQASSLPAQVTYRKYIALFVID
jgi:hypothetical protein